MASMIKLKESTVVRYSPMERELFNLLLKRAGRRASTEWLTERVYQNLGRERPQSSRIIVAGAVRSLMRKVKRNGEPFRISKTFGAGPYPTEVSIEDV